MSDRQKPNGPKDTNEKDLSEKSNKWKKFTEESPEEQPFEEEEHEKQGLNEIDYPTRQALEDQLMAVEKERDELRNQTLRTKAEMDNLHRRNQREVENAYKFGSEKLLRDLIPVSDALSRSLQGEEPTDPQLKNMREGMRMTLDQLEKALAKHGVEQIVPNVGDVFDPQFHEAVSVMHDPKAKTNTILKVLDKGYILNGRLLRAAMVIVAQ